MTVTINILDVSLLILGCLAIWGILPQEFREELGALGGLMIEIAWVIFWIFYFVYLGHNIQIT